MYRTNESGGSPARIDLMIQPLPELAHDVRLAAMALARRVRENTSTLGPHLFTVLAYLEDKPRTAAELACSERVSAPSMSRTVGELCERGLAAREADPADARQKIITLTKTGRKALAQGRMERDTWMVERMADCSSDEIDVLQRAVDILRRLSTP